MKLNRELTIKAIRQKIIELNIKNCEPLFETYTNQQLVKACGIYAINPWYFE